MQLVNLFGLTYLLFKDMLMCGDFGGALMTEVEVMPVQVLFRVSN